ncbi:TadE/TadG family type IV pilus assembly protein [Glaesserella sp.]|uniref:TadE/TadG family type IV pilus assembly protein n=1 Tax=Glaesserella sp. TaxID=2094731 RepID=UPI0035A0B59C
MKSILKNFVRSNKGTTTVEFVLTIVIYFTVVFMIFEWSRLTLASAYWDLAIAESTRISRAQEAEGGNYEELFKKTLKEQRALQAESGMVMFMQIPTQEDKVTVNYVDCTQGQNSNCLDALLNNQYKQPTMVDGQLVSPTGELATLASYKLQAGYKPLIPMPFLSGSLSESILSREIVVVQEYERSLFK